MRLVIVSGLSGSGKSVALDALEDMGFYCIDNVPAALLGGLIIGLTQELGVVFAPSSTKLIGVFVVFILVLLLRPTGLFGQRAS